MDEEIEEKQKKKRKVVSFRVNGDTYDKNKKAIRKDVNGVLKSYSEEGKVSTIKIKTEKAKKDKKLEKEPQETGEKIFTINLEEYEQRDYNIESMNVNDGKVDYPKETFTEQELYDIRNYEESRERENLNLEKPQQNTKKKVNYFDQFKDKEKRKLHPIHEDVKKVDNSKHIQKKKDEKSLKELFEEFKELIDPKNKKFKEFFNQ